MNMRAERVMCLSIKNYIETQGEDLSTVKVYATYSSNCCSILCGFVFFRVVLPCYMFSCFSVLFSIMITSLGRESWSICVLCICLFIFLALLSVFFSSIWCHGLAATCNFGTPWTFHFTFCAG